MENSKADMQQRRGMSLILEGDTMYNIINIYNVGGFVPDIISYMYVSVTRH